MKISVPPSNLSETRARRRGTEVLCTVVTAVAAIGVSGSARADIPKEAARLVRDHKYDQALDRLERRLSQVSEGDRDERFRTLAWMTLAALSQTVRGLEDEAAETHPSEGETSRDRYGLGNLGLESLESFQAFEPLNALVCMALNTEARLELMEELYDADEDELTCPYGLQKQGVDVSNKARFFLGSALLSTSAVLWDHASRFPRRFQDTRELYRRAAYLRAFTLRLLKDKSDNWAKQESSKEGETKPKDIYFDLGQRLACRMSPDLEGMVQLVRETALAEGKKKDGEGSLPARELTVRIGRLQAEGRRIGTVQFSEAERGHTLASYGMLTPDTFEAFRSGLAAETLLHDENRKRKKTMGDWVQCSGQRLTWDLSSALTQRIQGAPLESEYLLDELEKTPQLIQGNFLTSLLTGKSTLTQIRALVPISRGVIASHEGRVEDAKASFTEGYTEQLTWLEKHGDDLEKNAMIPTAAAVRLSAQLPVYASVLGNEGQKDATMTKVLAQLEDWHTEILSGYAEQVEEYRKTAGHLAIIDAIREYGGFSRQVNDRVEKALAPINRIREKIPAGVPVKGRGSSFLSRMPGPLGSLLGGGGPNSRPLPEVTAEVEEIMTAVEALEDLKPTSVEKIRKLENDVRLVQLRAALTYLELEDLQKAQSYLDELRPYGDKRDYNAFVSPVVSYEWYVRGRLAKAGGQKRKARKAFSLAVDYYYFAPRTRWPVFPSSTYLLEQVAHFAYEDGRPMSVLRFAELARGVMSDSPNLFHFLPGPELEQFAERLRGGFVELRTKAEARAKQRGETEDFEKMNERLDERLAMSTRQGESPLSSQYVGLEKLVKWLEDEELRRYLRDLEVYVSLWENRAVAKYRADFLTREAKRSVGKFDLPDDDDWGKAAMTSMFEDKGGKTGEPPEVTALRLALPRDTAFLSYWLAGNALFVVAGHRKRIETQRLSLRENGLALLRGDLSLELGPVREELYAKLIAPYAKQLRSRVIVLASGPLARLKFAALTNPSTGQYFGDEHLLRSLPLLQYVAGISTKKLVTKPSASILAPWDVTGRPLPGGAAEAQMVGKVFPGLTASSHAVTRKLLDQALPDTSLLHFAGHAVVEQNVPDFTRLMIGGGESKRARGYFVHDIKTKRLDGMRLAVLSACTTGVGPKRAGIGFSSLSAAFLFSGVDAVVSSVERVDDDQTRILMETFYRLLSEGLAKDLALQKAQQHVRSMDAEARGWSPTGWAAFSVSGNPAPVLTP